MHTLVRLGLVDDAPGIAHVHVAAWQAAYQHVLSGEYLAALSVREREDRWRDALASQQEAVFVVTVQVRPLGDGYGLVPRAGIQG